MDGNNPVDAANGASSLSGLSGSGSGNNTLNSAFDYAIREASQTLTITTKKGADLYALKQRPQ